MRSLGHASCVTLHVLAFSFCLCEMTLLLGILQSASGKPDGWHSDANETT